MRGASDDLDLAVAGAALIGVLLTTLRPDHRIVWVLGDHGGRRVAAGGSTRRGRGARRGLLVGAPRPSGRTGEQLPAAAGLVVPLGLMLTPTPGMVTSRHARGGPVLAVVALGTRSASFAVSAALTWNSTGCDDRQPARPRHAGGRGAWAPGGRGYPRRSVASAVAFVVRLRGRVPRSPAAASGRASRSGFEGSLSLLVGAALWGVVPGAQVLPALALLALPTGIAIAILKYRLYEIDLVVNRTLVYGAMTIGVVVAYVAVVGLVGTVLTPRGDLMVSLVVTGIVAVGFQPVRAIVQRSVNRLMYGERDDPYTALAGLGKTLTSSVQLDAVLPRTVETLGETLALQYVGIAVAGEIVAAYGSPGSETFDVPLVHQGARVGDLLIAARSGERFRERDHRLVADLAPQVAAAVHAVELSRDLRSARERIVQLREEERRRIRRDLHDGLGPALAGLTFTLEAVRNLAATDLRRADELLVSATEQVQTMIADVRQLIYGLRPRHSISSASWPRFEGSLRRSRPRRRRSASLPRRRCPHSRPRRSGGDWIAQEALTNVRRHAAATRRQLRVVIEPSRSGLEIEDDGRGSATIRQASAFTDERASRRGRRRLRDRQVRG